MTQGDTEDEVHSNLLEAIGLCFAGRRKLKHAYVPDLICHEQIIVELKAVKELADEHRAQLLNYLKATGRPRGLLINFEHYPQPLIALTAHHCRVPPRASCLGSTLTHAESLVF